MSRARDLADSADLNFDSGTLVIDSANNRVGIGTGSPTAPLHIYSASANRPLIESNSTSQAGLILKNTDREFRILNGSSSLSVYDTTSGSEAMRIDSSGNLLVGTTSTALATNAGINLISSGRVSATVSGGPSGEFTRIDSDGDIVQFRKGGTTVGSIGVFNTDNLFISGNSTHAGIGFSDAHVEGFKNGSTQNGTIDLGSSGARFKDLYLSGGVYLGGTGAANYLDDYEEGTFTLTDTSGAGLAITAQATRYIKIGKIVTVSFEVIYPSNSNGSPAKFGGFPFTIRSFPNFQSITDYGSSDLIVMGNTNSTDVILRNHSNGNLSNATVAGKFFYGYGTYITN